CSAPFGLFYPSLHDALPIYLFARQLFLRARESDLTSERPGFTILCVPQFRTNPRTHGTRSDAAIIIDFQERLVLIAGTQYAGEIDRKSTRLNSSHLVISYAV